MAKMSDYPSVEDTEQFTQEQKAAFLGSAMCIATGSKTAGGSKVTANIPLSDITPVVPTKLSDLTDDITQQTVVANDTRPVSGAAVSSAMASFGGFQVTTIDPNTHRPVVSGTIDPKAIYLTPSGESGTENAYDEWICTDTSVPTWEKVGVTRVDLSQYYTKGQTDTAIETAIDSIAPVQNSVLYGGGSGGFNKRMDLLYDNTLTKVSGSNGYELKVAVPVPPPGLNAHRGEVLTVNNSDEAVWAAPASGLPDPTGVTNGYVLTVNNGAASWAAPAGGGGGGGATIIRFSSNTNTATLNGTTLTPTDAIALFKSNPNIIVRRYRTWDNEDIEEGNYYPGDYTEDEDDQHNEFEVLNFFSRFNGTGGAYPTTELIVANTKTGQWSMDTYT